jgi:outer membrane protein assembly complex protein YaeT
MRRPILPWALVAVAGLSSLATAQNTHDQQREAPEVRGVAITGAKHVDYHDLLTSISTRASKCRSFLIEPFCLISHSPTFEDKYYLNEAELQRDVIRIKVYYYKVGYREADVDTVVTRTGRRQVKIEFKVTEGRPTIVRRIAITYDTALISTKIRDRLTTLHAKDPLNLVKLDSMRVMFQDQLWDQGYGDAVVDTIVRVNQPQYIADVELRLTQNHLTTIGRVSITGNQRVSVNTIRNSLTFNTGDLYRQSAILESERNLYESNLFKLAMIDVPVQYDSVKNVNIDVTEAPLHEARLGPGFSTVDFVQFQSHYTSYNLFGGARRLDIDGTLGNLFAGSLAGRGLFRNVNTDVQTASPNSNVSPFLQPTYNASIDFKQPAFLQRPADAAGFGGFAHRSINPGVFIDRGFGGQATFTHQLALRAPLSLTYRYEANRVEASDVYFCVNFGVCDTPTIASLRSRQSLSPLTLTGFVDRSDLPFSPTKGYVARVDIEHASALTGSDYRYNRGFLDAALYGHQSGTQRVYTAHLRVGIIRSLSTGVDGGVLHPRKRFYAGGANSVRGYAESQLGPRILTIDDSTLVRGATSVGGGTCAATVAAIKFCDPNTSALKNTDFLSQPLGGTSLLEGSVEYRVPLPLGETLRHIVAAVFLDGGIVGSGDIRGLSTVGNIVKGTGAVTPGFGFRYESPVGPIRVDFGVNPNRTENLGVVTAVTDSTGTRRIVPLAIARSYTPSHTFLGRLVLHFSIGEAY